MTPEEARSNGASETGPPIDYAALEARHTVALALQSERGQIEEKARRRMASLDPTTRAILMAECAAAKAEADLISNRGRLSTFRPAAPSDGGDRG